MLDTVLIPNGIALTLLFTLVLSGRRAVRHRLWDDRLFYGMVLSCALQCVGESATYLMDGHPGLRATALLLNSFLYINNILFAFMWTVYADYKVFGDRARLRRLYPLVAIPALAVAAGSLVNLFVPVFYSISAANVYQRTGLYILPCIATYAYLAYGAVLIYRSRSRVGRYLFLPAILFMIPIFMGSMLQFLFYGLSLVWVGTAIALMSLYINVQNQVSYTDNLTGLYTRHYMYQYLAAETRRKPTNLRLAGVMLDLDRFKSINDTFGHLMGDEAIRAAGRLLYDAAGDHALAVRYAGDEFILLQYVRSEQEVRELMARVDAAAEAFCAQSGVPYRLSFSKGYSFYEPARDTTDAFLGRMDAAMYEDKKRKKACR